MDQRRDQQTLTDDGRTDGDETPDALRGAAEGDPRVEAEAPRPGAVEPLGRDEGGDDERAETTGVEAVADDGGVLVGEDADDDTGGDADEPDVEVVLSDGEQEGERDGDDDAGPDGDVSLAARVHTAHSVGHDKKCISEVMNSTDAAGRRRRVAPFLFAHRAVRAMTGPWDDWDHVLKVDPDKELCDGETFEDVVATGTDALEIGGTRGMTTEKMERVVAACADHGVPIYQEPSNPGVVIDHPALAGYLIPTVLNAGDPFWITGAHKEWVRIDGPLDWDRTSTEAYIVLNPEAAVAEYTDADCDLSAEDVGSYARVAEKMFGQEIVYVEYSGTFGDTEKVQAARDALDDSTLFYGGGIRDYDAAYEMGQHADVVVVGDLLHDEGCEAVRETVEGVKDAHAVEPAAE